MEKDANIWLCISSPPPPPPPREKTPRETAYVLFFFCSYLKFLLVKRTSGWPLRSSAEMLHEIQVWLIIVVQPESSQLKVVSSWLGLGQCARCHKKNWVDPFLDLAGKDLCSLPGSLFPWLGGAGGRGGGGELIQSKMLAGPSFSMHKMWPCHNSWAG